MDNYRAQKQNWTVEKKIKGLVAMFKRASLPQTWGTLLYACWHFLPPSICWKKLRLMGWGYVEEINLFMLLFL